MHRCAVVTVFAASLCEYVALHQSAVVTVFAASLLAPGLLQSIVSVMHARVHVSLMHLLSAAVWTLPHVTSCNVLLKSAACGVVVAACLTLASAMWGGLHTLKAGTAMHCIIASPRNELVPVSKIVFTIMQVAYHEWTDADGVKEEGDYPDLFRMQTDMVSCLPTLCMQL